MHAIDGMDQAEPSKSFRLLVLADQFSDVELLRQAFAKRGVFQLDHIADGQQAQALVLSTASSAYDVIILDSKFAGIYGEEIARNYLANEKNPPKLSLVVMASGLSPAAAARLGLAGMLVIDKPLGLDAYSEATQRILAHCGRPNLMQDPLPSIMEQLKGETKLAHETLEKTLDIHNRILTAESYIQLLKLFYGFYQPYVAQLAAFAGQLEFWIPDLPQRVPLRLAKLKTDLEILGRSDHVPLRCAVLDSKSNLAHCMGGLYVLEGSTLGGQIISRMIGGSLGYTPEAGCAFFAGYGAQTGSMWKSFCLSLEAYAAEHPDQRRLIVSGAQSTFERFGEWILENQ